MSGTIGKVAELISHLKPKSICFLTGAGVSVAAGIPDFRSPGGMYDTLRPDLLTATQMERRAMQMDPTAVVSWDVFRQNQLPYLELRRPFIRGVLADQDKNKDAYRPTLSHFFIRVCHDKGLLRRVYTQNIDGLDYKTGTPTDVQIPVHGTLGRVECEGCKAPYPSDQFCDALSKNIKDIYGIDPSSPAESTPIPCLKCNKPLVKPATVLYGRSLPMDFFDHKDPDLTDLPLLIVAGTSLTVRPASTVASDADKRTTRVVINMEPVGEEIGLDYASESDIFLGGECDASFLEIAKACGWLLDLAKYKHLMAPNSVQLLEQHGA